MLASDKLPAGALFRWKLDICSKRVYILDTFDYPRLPLFSRTGCTNSTAFLNPVFWLLFEELTGSTWRSMSQLFCSVDKMEALASSEYDMTSVAIGAAGVCLFCTLCQRFPRTWLPTLLA